MFRRCVKPFLFLLEIRRHYFQWYFATRIHSIKALDVFHSSLTRYVEREYKFNHVSRVLLFLTEQENIITFPASV